MCFLPFSIQTGFAWSHFPPIPHLSIPVPSSQYPSLHVYFTVETQVNGGLPSIPLFSIDPGSLQWGTEGKKNKVSIFPNQQASGKIDLKKHDLALRCTLILSDPHY